MQTLPSKAILGSAYRWMATGKDMVNTGITKTSSLFQEKWSGAWHGPGREVMGRVFHMAGLLWFLGRHWAKAHPWWHGCTIYTEMGTGDDVCSDITLHMPSTWTLAWHFLRHILDNGCWHQKMCHRPITANYAIYRLGNGHTGIYWCKKVSHTVQVQFHCDICLAHQNFINKCCCIMCYTVHG